MFICPQKPSTSPSGITRKIAIKLSAEEGFKINEEYFSYDQLYSVNEAFITSSTRNVVPVVRIDDIELGDGKPGKVVEKLRKSFKRYLENY